MKQLFQNWRSVLFQPISILPLVYMRVAFGAIMMWEVWRYFHHGWIKRYYIDPIFYFTYYGFDFLRPLPGDAMYTFFYGMGFLAFCILIGFAYRQVTTLFFLGFTYWFLLDQSNYLNHFYLIALISFMMIFVPAHRALSVDALINRKMQTWQVPSWGLLWLRFQIGVVYIGGGIAKLNMDWLQGEPMRMWLADRTDFTLIGRYFTQEWMVYGMSYGGLLLDLLAIPALLWRRTRWIAVASLLFFHLMNDNLFSIGIFPWFMIAITPLFFPVAWWGRRSRSAQSADETETPATAPKLTMQQTALVSFLAVYGLVQILFPLRHVLYPGNVSWTEEGHNFAWHMKLRSKSGWATFTVVDPQSGQSWQVDPLYHLTSRQLGNLPEHPDKLLLFSHYLADIWQKSGYEDIEVYVESYVSLNGRERQLIVDPCVNLAAVPRRPLPPADWVVPLQYDLKANEPMLASALPNPDKCPHVTQMTQLPQTDGG